MYKILQGYGLPDQEGMRAKAAEDMDALDKEHTGEQQKPEVVPAMQHLRMPTAQLLAFEQVQGMQIPHNCCLYMPQLSDIQVH